MTISSKPVDADFMSGLSNLEAVGRYKITGKLGQGGAGVVYLGEDPYIKRNVAIKLSKPSSDKSRQSFFVEAQSTGRLAHSNIVTIYDAGLYRDYCYIAMEFVDGPTLEKHCRPDDLLSITETAEIVFQVCHALDYAQKQGIIHRDIKPSNIMINPDGIPKVTDFGIAQVTDDTLELGIWGTPSYMSPEQLKDGDLTQNHDVFSLGCVLYEMLTGVKAFPGENPFTIMFKITNEDPVSMSRLRPGLPAILEEITLKALAKDPEKRYQTFMDFAYDLRVALRGFQQASENQDAKDIFEFIHHLPFFKNLTIEQVRELGSSTTIGKIPAGRLIMAEGEIDDTFYIMLSGKAKIMKGAREVAFIHTGECFGEMAYIAGQPRTADVVADTDCIVMKISATIIDKASESIQLLFFKNFAKILVRRLAVH